MNGVAAQGNIALLIDADNASPATIDPVLTVLAEFGTVNVRRIYGNWDKPALKGWTEILLRYALEPQQQFDLTKGKNATDLKMTIDAMDLLFRGRITGFGLMSSDSDFAPLAQRIRQDGIPVFGFGRHTAPLGFRTACTRFIDVEELLKTHAKDKVETPAANGGTDPELLELLTDAYGAARRDERGFASLSEIGARAGNRSSFDTRNYGFRRLADLVRSLPGFETELRDGGHVYVRRAP